MSISIRIVFYICYLFWHYKVILLKLALPDSRINARSHSFAVRIIPLWNSLPNDVVNLSQLQIYTCLNRLSKTN